MDSNTVIGYEYDGSEIKLVDLQNELKTIFVISPPKELYSAQFAIKMSCLGTMILI